jgi:hypothetical protein
MFNKSMSKKQLEAELEAMQNWNATRDMHDHIKSVESQLYARLTYLERELLTVRSELFKLKNDN